MKVKELINELEKYDPECMVIVNGYEDGYNEVNTTLEFDICLNTRTEWYYGRHEKVLNQHEPENYIQIKAVHISGRR